MSPAFTVLHFPSTHCEAGMLSAVGTTEDHQCPSLCSWWRDDACHTFHGLVSQTKSLTFSHPEVKASLIGLQSGGGATAAMLGALVPLCCSRTWRTKILWPSLATLPLSLAVQGLAAESSGLLTSWDVHLRFGLDQKDGQFRCLLQDFSWLVAPQKRSNGGGRPRALWELQAASRPDCSASLRVGQQLGGTLSQRPLVPEASILLPSKYGGKWNELLYSHFFTASRYPLFLRSHYIQSIPLNTNTKQKSH